MAKRLSALVLVLAAIGACKTESSPHAGNYVLDREAMRAELEATLAKMPAQARDAMRAASEPLIDQTETDLELENGGDGTLVVKTLGVSEGNDTVTERAGDRSHLVRATGRQAADHRRR